MTLPLRPLGRTGLDVSVLGLGTVKFGRNRGVKYPEPFALPDDDALGRLLDEARELGINLLDTAPAYGAAEQRLGRLLAGQRQHWLLATKVGEWFDGERSHFDFSPEGTQRSVARSLARLRTSYLDLVLIHSDGDDLRILDDLGTLDVLQDLKRRGLVRAVGISHKTADGARRALALGVDVLMTELSLNEPSMAPVIAEAALVGVGVLVKKALASGHADSASLAFAARQPGVTTVVVGTLDPAHLGDNARVVETAIAEGSGAGRQRS